MKDNEQLQYENEQLAQGNNKLWTQLEKSAEILSHHEAYISLLEEENAKLKEVILTIKHQCELLMPKNGLNPVTQMGQLCQTFINLIRRELGE